MYMMIIISMISLCWWRKNIIMLLMSLELMMISTFTIIMPSNHISIYISLLMMMVIMVSGSSVGLSLLVSISHSHNSSSSTHINLLTFVKNNLT